MNQHFSEYSGIHPTRFSIFGEPHGHHKVKPVQLLNNPHVINYILQHSASHFICLEVDDVQRIRPGAKVGMIHRQAEFSVPCLTIQGNARWSVSDCIFHHRRRNKNSPVSVFLCTGLLKKLACL